MRGLTPHDAKSYPALGEVVCGVHALLPQQDPQRGHLTRQAPNQAPGIIGAFLVAIEEATKTRIPRLPLASRGWLVGHRAQALKFLAGSVAAGPEVGVA